MCIWHEKRFSVVNYDIKQTAWVLLNPASAKSGESEKVFQVEQGCWISHQH